jgi:hypothetical protein
MYIMEGANRAREGVVTLGIYQNSERGGMGYGRTCASISGTT